MSIEPTPVTSLAHLKNLMNRYRTDSLVNITPQEFEKRLQSFLKLVDHKMEGFHDPERQRDLSIKFHWGHNHDFGAFALEGRMGDRHLAILAAFGERFKALPQDLAGCKVLDIGCWTGGTSLLLCAMGAKVVAIEEVKKYVEAVQFLKTSFCLGNLEVRHMSLYDCVTPEFQDAFDYVLFSGVLYHLTDPILGLRLVFNCLRDGGKCLLETAAVQSGDRILAYEGPDFFHSGDKSSLSRGGWNWFLPSPPAVRQMMQDVGFAEIECTDVVVGDRVLAVGKRIQHVDVMRGGFSLRTAR